MYQPLVSIIIPVYNGANYLKYAIESALSQTYFNCEVLVINDGSKDNGETESIALSFGNKIKYFYKENGGVATALNLGIQHMQGEYFSWLSHDDIYYPNKVEEEVKELQKIGNMTAIVFSDYEILDMETQEKVCSDLSVLYSRNKLENSVFTVLEGIVHGCSLLIHKSHFERIGLFDETLITTQDYDLWFRMFRNQTLLFLDKPLIMGRIHQQQGSKTITAHRQDQVNLHRRFLEILEEDEIVSLYGSFYMFYYRMMLFFKRNDIMEAYNYSKRLFMESNMPEDISTKLQSLSNQLRDLSNGKTEKICIFCAGYYGKALKQDLNNRLIKLDCFADNNPNKWRSIVDGTYCVPPFELDKEKTLVIVCVKEPDSIIKDLKNQGFLYIISKREVEALMEDIPPIKWMVETRQYE